MALRVAATPERAFEAFTREIGQWWQPDQLFWFTDRSATGRLAFDPGPDGRLIERQPDGDVFEIGRVTTWEPPAHLAFEWRQASFAPDQFTEVHVKFEPAGDGTRVTVEHYGWDALPQEHVARHGFPLEVIQLRLAVWWRALLHAYAGHPAYQ